jgi:hypothetical protein
VWLGSPTFPVFLYKITDKIMARNCYKKVDNNCNKPFVLTAFSQDLEKLKDSMRSVLGEHGLVYTVEKNGIPLENPYPTLAEITSEMNITEQAEITVLNHMLTSQYKDDRDTNAKAVALIRQYMDEHLCNKYKQYQHPYLLWEAVTTEHQGFQYLPLFQNDLETLISMKLTDYRTTEDYCEAMRMCFNNLATYNVNFCDEARYYFALRGLPNDEYWSIGNFFSKREMQSWTPNIVESISYDFHKADKLFNEITRYS